MTAPLARARRFGRDVAMLALLAAAPAAAELGPSIVVEPWGEAPHWADTIDEPIFFDRADAGSAGGSARVFHWDSHGRIKFERGNRQPVFALGYRALTMDVSADADAIAGQFNDVALVGAGCIRDIWDRWTLVIIGGAGTANDGHWSDGDAVYGVGALVASRELDGRNSVHLGIAYNGNRGLLPDVPLPAIAYTYREGDRLKLELGFPETSFRCRLTDDFALALRCSFPATASADSSYRIGGGFSVFGRYARVFDGFHIDGGGNRRLFYEHDRVSAGVRWVTRFFDISLGSGYAFNHRFRTGFDLRHLHDTAELDDGFFGFVKIQGTF